MTFPEGAAVDAALANDSETASPGAPVARPAGRALSPWLTVQAIVTFAAFAGVQSVLIPNQMTLLDPAGKVAGFAAATSTFAVVTVIVQPVVGAFSDRTRSRFGRRAIWMMLGAALGAFAMAALSLSNSVPAIVFFAGVLSLGVNAVLAPLTATVADRYPRERRGGASALFGLGSLLGGTLGSMAAGALAAQLGVAYGVFGVALLVVTFLFLLFNRDFSSKTMHVEPFRLRGFLASFWVDPRKHPDFGWGFLARFCFVLGYYTVASFTFFLLTDYVGLSLPEANANVGIIGLAALPAMVVSILVSGYLSDRLGRRKIFLWVATGILVVGFLIPLAMPTVPGIILLSVFTGFGYGVYQSADMALMTEIIPGGGVNAGKDLGILNIATGIPQAMAPAIAAVVIQTALGFTGFFVLGAIAVILGALALIPIKSVR